MSDQSRRNFMKTASLGAAAVGAAAVIPGTTADAATPRPASSGPAHDGSFAVWVDDPKSGNISVLVGEREVVHHDPALAQHLARIAARG